MTKAKKTTAKKAPAKKTAAKKAQTLKVQGLRAGHVSQDRETVTLEWVQENGEALGLEMPAALLDAMNSVLNTVSLAVKTPAPGETPDPARVMADFPRGFNVGEMIADGGDQRMVLMQLMVPTDYGQSTRSFALDAESATKIAASIQKQAEATGKAAK